MKLFYNSFNVLRLIEEFNVSMKSSLFRIYPIGTILYSKHKNINYINVIAPVAHFIIKIYPEYSMPNLLNIKNLLQTVKKAVKPDRKKSNPGEDSEIVLSSPNVYFVMCHKKYTKEISCTSLTYIKYSVNYMFFFNFSHQIHQYYT